MSQNTLLVVALAVFQAVSVQAQPDRLTEPIDDQHRVPITGHLRKIANLQADEGPIESSFRLRGTLFLKPSELQRAALRGLLLDLQDPHSSNYHQWLTPEDYALRFGVSKPDAVRIADWLQGEGLTVDQVARGRSWIVFHGTADAVQRAFQADLHRYRTGNKRHYANASNPSVPRALSDIIGAISGLDDILPEYDYTAANGSHSLAPDDLATIYDFARLLQQGIDGTGQKVVVVGGSDLSAQGLRDFQTQLAHFNLPAPTLQQILNPNFPDPGITGALGEAVGDLQTLAGVARNATIFYVYSGNVYDALIYAVDQNLAPVITASAHLGCDATVPEALMSSYQMIAQQGNAQGITWVNSSGDSGAAGCDPNGIALASHGLASRFPADIPEVTAVGGTQFNEQGGSYWSSTNSASGESALSYIPEMAWNESGSLSAVWAGGGGASAFFRKPSWQTGPGVPNDGARDVPDVALTAALNHDPYLATYNGVTQNVGGGTSAAAPLFAGMVALLNHYLIANSAPGQPGLGNLNQMLYRLTETSPAAFHDITTGSNIVQCVIGTPDCTTGSMGYSAGPGFDLATGLGSIDMVKLAAGALALSMPAQPPVLTPGSVVNGATYLEGGLVSGSWALVKGSNLSNATRVWGSADFTGLGNDLPISLSATSVNVNGMPAAVYYVSPGQVNFQVPSGVSGTITVQVFNNGVGSNIVTGTATGSAPGIFPIAANGTNYAAGVFLDGMIAGDPSMGPSFRNATAGDVVQLFATALVPEPAGVQVTSQSVSGMSVSVAIGSVTFPADTVALVAVGEFQINITVPQQFANLPAGSYPVTISVNGVSSPATINSSPPGPLVIPIRH